MVSTGHNELTRPNCATINMKTNTCICNSHLTTVNKLNSIQKHFIAIQNIHIKNWMSRRHADNWSHPGHYLVDPYTWPWSPNGHSHVNRPSHSEIQLFQNLTMKIHGQGHVCGQRSRSHLTFKIQRSWSRSRPLVTFEAWSSIDMFAFCYMAIEPLLAEI